MAERVPNYAARDAVATVQVRPVARTSVLRLRSWLPESSSAASQVALAGQALPRTVGETLFGSARALCLGPGDWLIVSDQHTASNLREHFEPDLSRQGLALVDLTDGMAVIEVYGPTTREVLSKGCGLDMHPRSFPPGRCARTRFAQIAVVIECLDAQPRFELTVPRSYLHYVHSWLADAAMEFGVDQR